MVGHADGIFHYGLDTACEKKDIIALKFIWKMQIYKSASGTNDMIAPEFIPGSGMNDLIVPEFIPGSGTNDLIAPEFIPGSGTNDLIAPKFIPGKTKRLAKKESVPFGLLNLNGTLSEY